MNVIFRSLAIFISGVLFKLLSIETYYFSLSKNSFTWSYFWCGYAILFNISYAVLYPVSIYVLFLNTVEVPDLTTLLNFSLYCINFVVSLAICVLNLYNATNNMKVENEAIKLFANLQEQFKYPNGEIVEVFSIKSILILMGQLSLTITVITVKYVLIYKGNNDNGRALYSFVLFIPYLTIPLVQCRYQSVLHGATEFWRLMNLRLNYLAKRIDHLKDKSNYVSINEQCSVSDEIDRCAIYHYKLCRIIDTVKETNNPTICIVLAVQFINIVTLVYFWYFYFKAEKYNTFYFSILNFALNLFGLLFDMKCGNDLKRQIERSGIIIHDFVQFNLDKRFVSSVEMFTLQLIHMEEHAKVWACDLFIIDYVQLRYVILAVISNSMILIQFQMQE